MQDHEWQAASFPSDLDFCWEEASAGAPAPGGALDDFGLSGSSTLEWNKGLYLNSAPELHNAPAPEIRSFVNDTQRLQGVSRSSSAKQQQLFERVHGKPPPGCHSDAIKIFVGNLPKGCTEPQLLPFFETIGKVIDIVVVRDKATRESKGSAFVWYQTRAAAEEAITQLNMRYILPDPTGKQTRPLALRKAQAAHQPHTNHINQWTPAPRSSALGEAPLDWLMQGSSGQAQAQARQIQLPSSSPSPSTWRSFPGAASLQVNAPRAAPNPSGAFSLDSLLHSSLPPAPKMAEVHASTHIMNSLAQVYGMPHQMSGLADGPAVPGTTPGPGRPETALGLDGLLGLPGMRAQADSQRSVTATFTITKEQLVTLSEFMHRVRSVTGSQLHVAPGSSAGMFSLFVLGSQLQVDAARMLLGRILGLMN